MARDPLQPSRTATDFADDGPGQADGLASVRAVGAGQSVPVERRQGAPTLRTTVLIGTALVLTAVLYLARAAVAPFVIGRFLVCLLDPHGTPA